MHLDISAVDIVWGWVNGREWDYKIGSVLVVRKDGRDVTPQQVEAHAKFCYDVIEPAVNDQNNLDALEDYFSGRGDCTAEEVARGKNEMAKALMCRAKFEEFFEKFRGEKLADGDGTWEHAVSPYEM
ncbi:uncharacterized protein LY89DRAFT_650028 [Mollisia scopiformis]|uniref:Uncharacterized protein n=1 Tax=Mollisia scopiformis TaxID=149040 RepID=A0A194X2P6_MOLSC|nr:uncharacterized protein LY89DRAFT_650028 [Mollisia scopiformis]KUJ14294.1 hypothetical protein LY89DRAFT_650028 [Mollisia scopiformis]